MGARILTDEQIDLACEWRESGLTYRRIANRFAARGIRISIGSISWACLTRGADLPIGKRRPLVEPGAVQPYARGNHVVRAYTSEDDALLRVLDLQGFTVTAMANRLGRKPNSIRGRLATLARHDARREDMQAGL